MTAPPLVRWFGDLRLKDVPAVGGKTASLGELHALLGGRVPDGFALTAEAYRQALAGSGAVPELRRLLSDFDHHDLAQLATRAAKVRGLVYEATGNAGLCQDITADYRALEKPIRESAEKDPTTVPFQSVDVALECTGQSSSDPYQDGAPSPYSGLRHSIRLRPDGPTNPTRV